MLSTFQIIIRYRQGLLDGLSVTLELCLVVWLGGLFWGLILGVAGARWKAWIGGPARMASFIISGIPLLVLLFWLHYPLQSMLGLVIDPFFTSAAALLVINTLAVADITRVAICDFPRQYVTAAQVCGLTPWQTFSRIKLPIIMRQIVPGLLVAQVNVLHLTLFASLISVEEIFRVAQRINAQIYMPVEVYSALAIFFLFVCLPLNGLALYLKNRFSCDLSER